MKKRKCKLIIRIAAACAAITLAMPSLSYIKSYAKENTQAVQQIHHVHLGNPSEGGACYGTEIKHVHDGDGEKGGSCFLSPVYHVHNGNEKEGGECYQTEIRHSHEGTEKEGKGCYGKPVYHAHIGSANTKGGCYGTPVYHKHTGSAGAGGGCYGKPVYHGHTGSPASKGGCYGKAVYHKHTGSPSDGSGCYTKAVYHTHAGNETSGGKCYGPVKHQHVSSCYEEAECALKYVGNMQKVREENGYCYHHGEANIVHFRATYQHMSCGIGTEELGHKTCWGCQYLDFSHNYNRIICGKDENTVEKYQRICGKETSTVESWELGCGKNSSSIEKYELNCGKNGSTVDSYQLNCNKNGSTVDSYQLNCNKTGSYIEKYALNCGKTGESIDAYDRSCTKNEETVDGYSLSCEKTGETVDSYALSCPKDENSGYAGFSVSGQDSQWTSGDVVLRASVQDENGFLQLPENPFRWEGNGIDNVSSDEVKITENGIYYVHLNAENEDVDKEELVLSVEVKNIDRTAPVIEKIENIEGKGTDNSGVKDKRSRIIRIKAKDLQPDGSPGSGMAPEAYSFDGGKTWQKDNELEVKKNGIVSVAVRDCCGNIAFKDVEILNAGEDSGNGNTSGSGQDKENGNTGDGEKNENDESGKEEGGSGKDDIGKDDEGTGNSGKEESGKDDTGKGDEGTDNSGKEESGKDNSEKEDAGNDSSGTVNTGEEGKKEDAGSGQNSGNPENSQKIKDQLLADKNQKEKQNSRKGAAKKKSSLSEGNGTEERNGKGEEQNGSGKESKDAAEKEKMTFPDKKRNSRQEGYKRETMQSEMPKTASEPENGSRPVRTLRREAVEKTVKAVTFTVSSIMLAAGLIYLIYLMFRSIQVFDCDGEGKARYVGSCIMKKTEEGFEVRLPNMIWEHSATGQYSLRPGRMFARKHKGKELAVIAGEHKESVWIDMEIPLRLAMHV